MKTIQLTRGYFAFVDDEDYEEINKTKWRAMPVKNTDIVYAGNSRGTMHRQIMQALPGMTVDHIDGDGLNNQRSNLRICTMQQNFANARKRRSKCSSIYKGVYKRAGNTWKAEYCGEYLGSFKTEIEAARAYNQAIKAKMGEYARLNVLPEDELKKLKPEMSIDVVSPREVLFRFKTRQQLRQFIDLYMNVVNVADSQDLSAA